MGYKLLRPRSLAVYERERERPGTGSIHGNSPASGSQIQEHFLLSLGRANHRLTLDLWLAKDNRFLNPVSEPKASKGLRGNLAQMRFVFTLGIACQVLSILWTFPQAWMESSLPAVDSPSCGNLPMSGSCQSLTAHGQELLSPPLFSGMEVDRESSSCHVETLTMERFMSSIVLEAVERTLGLMHLVPAPAVRLMKRRVLSRPGVNSPWSVTRHMSQGPNRW